MQVSVAGILQSPESITRYDFNEVLPAPDEGEQLMEPVSGNLTIERVSDTLLRASGSFHTLLRSTCHRCGESFELPVAFTLNESLEVVESEPLSQEVEEVVSAAGFLDVSDLVRQTLLLSLPLRRLCGCEPQTPVTETATVDPRWAVLGTYPVDSN